MIKAWKHAYEVAHSENMSKMFGGDEVVETIKEPDRVQAVRIRLLEPEEQTDPEEGGFARENYRPLSEPVSVSAENVDLLARWLTSGSSYKWPEEGVESAKACEPSYGVILLFERGDWHVDVWLCFECNVFVVYESEHDSATQFFGGGGDFDLIHDELADVMKSLFPDDEAIQQL
jgi:hypothetical protein